MRVCHKSGGSKRESRTTEPGAASASPFSPDRGQHLWQPAHRRQGERGYDPCPAAVEADLGSTRAEPVVMRTSGNGATAPFCDRLQRVRRNPALGVGSMAWKEPTMSTENSSAGGAICRTADLRFAAQLAPKPRRQRYGETPLRLESSPSTTRHIRLPKTAEGAIPASKPSGIRGAWVTSSRAERGRPTSLSIVLCAVCDCDCTDGARGRPWHQYSREPGECRIRDIQQKSKGRIPPS